MPASLNAKEARRLFHRWEKADQRVKTEEWRDALLLLERADGLDRGNPDLLEDMGRLYDWAAYRKRAQHPVVRAFQEQELLYFRAAARLRPVSGYTWASVAQVKVALGELDDELGHAVRAAAALAPWEPAAQVAIADAGLAAWSTLPEDARAAVRRIVENGMRRQATDMVRIARNRGRLSLVCSWSLPVGVGAVRCKA